MMSDKELEQEEEILNQIIQSISSLHKCKTILGLKMLQEKYKKAYSIMLDEINDLIWEYLFIGLKKEIPKESSKTEYIIFLNNKVNEKKIRIKAAIGCSCILKITKCMLINIKLELINEEKMYIEELSKDINSAILKTAI